MAKSKNKHAQNIQNRHGQTELPKQKVISELEREILNEVELCAIGAKPSVYDLFEMAKELRILKEQTPKMSGAGEVEGLVSAPSEF